MKPNPYLTTPSKSNLAMAVQRITNIRNVYHPRLWSQFTVKCTELQQLVDQLGVAWHTPFPELCNKIKFPPRDINHHELAPELLLWPRTHSGLAHHEPDITGTEPPTVTSLVSAMLKIEIQAFETQSNAPPHPLRSALCYYAGNYGLQWINIPLKERKS